MHFFRRGFRHALKHEGNLRRRELLIETLLGLTFISNYGKPQKANFKYLKVISTRFRNHPKFEQLIIDLKIRFKVRRLQLLQP